MERRAVPGHVGHHDDHSGDHEYAKAGHAVILPRLHERAHAEAQAESSAASSTRESDGLSRIKKGERASLDRLKALKRGVRAEFANGLPYAWSGTRVGGIAGLPPNRPII